MPIIIKGARTGNLKNLDVTIKKQQINVFTGVSGSGKTSLVFNTIAAEAIRQMNQTYPSYVRNRLPHYAKPEVDSIENLSPAIVVNQKSLGDNRRSTVGTATDINSTLRLLFSRFGKPFVGFSDHFSFNHPNGMCQTCQGLGTKTTFNLSALLDSEKSLNEGAICFPTFEPGAYRFKRYTESGFFDNDKKIKDYTKEELDLLLYAPPRKPINPSNTWYKSSLYEGIIPRITTGFIQNSSKTYRKYDADIARVTTETVCPTCQGYRLNEKSLQSKINGKNLGECCAMELTNLRQFLTEIKIPEVQEMLPQVLVQLDYLAKIGLGYLNLARETSSLSGGESQRIKLVKALGSSLTDLLYILDEPSAGLHPQDLIGIGELIKAIKAKGNTVLLIDHHPTMIALADEIFELGPKAGQLGGKLMHVDTVASWQKRQKSLPKLQRQKLSVTSTTQKFSAKDISLHNVQHLTIDLPLGKLIAIAGVAGSGKSSFAKALKNKYPADVFYLTQKAIRGSERSSVLSYLGVFDIVRKLFGKTNHVSPQYFSANSKGACQNCKGKGYVETELAFLEPIRNTCEACHGTKFQPTILQYLYQGKNIAEVLALSITAGCQFFKQEPKIYDKLYWLDKIGLGYLTLGQTLNTLSGGELQRLKLAEQINQTNKMMILDEPTSGLSQKDMQALLDVFDLLLQQGNTLLMIEHNPTMIAVADWLIEFGPKAGNHGGQIIFAGTTVEAMNNAQSMIGKYLTV